MKKNKLTISLFIITMLFFLISYVSSTFINQDERKMFPLSILKGYSISFGEIYPVSLKKSFSASSLHDISIEVLNTDIQIKKSTSPNIVIELKGKYFNTTNPEDVIQHKIQNNTFTLRTDEKSSRRSVNFEGKMIIAIPDTIKKITYQSQFGDISINSMNLEYLKAKTVLGDISILETKCKELTVDTIDGDLSVKGQVEKLSINTIRGDSKLLLSNLSPQITFTSNSGDLTLAFQSNPNILINYSSVNGSLVIDKRFGLYKIEQKSPIKLGSGQGYLSINTVSGDSYVKKDY